MPLPSAARPRGRSRDAQGADLRGRCPETGRRNLTIATVGRFDGDRFTPDFEQELDFGTDAYAFQGFPDGEGRVMIAWLANWTDVSKKHDFQSAMTLPRRILIEDGVVLTPPIDAVELLIELDEAGAPFTLDVDHPDARSA